NRLKSQFLAAMSHELRTPLNSILGFSELLAEEIAGPLAEKQHHFVGRIRTAGTHLLHLINDILDLAKIEAGKVELHLEEFWLEEIVPEVLSNIRPLAMAKQLHLQSDCGSLAVCADRFRCKQILYNLLSNAVKFTPDGGEITLHAGASGRYICISVSDTGVGIAATDIGAVFDEFKQVGGEPRSSELGTGLGLTITRGLVEQHGGHIWVESTPGEGSRFSFTLPCAAQLPAPVSTPAVSEAGHLVLVIDDESSGRELLSSFLSPEFRVQTAASGPEGAAQARRLQPDVITLNMLASGKGGMEALWELKSDPATSGIPIIIVSVVDQRAMGFALGAADYLLKPISKHDLLQAVRKQVAGVAGQETLLLVDDDPEARMMMEQVLTAAGYQCLSATGGQEALALLQRTKVDGILLDLMMPEMDGFEVIRRLRDDASLRNIPLFVLTAKDLSASEIELLRRETLAFFKKGIPWKQELLAQVRSAIARHRTRPAAAG
ncbi:MAG TPA: response regulator, partial [Prosthecobacter sp.]|nr:response regulator [Prosthecobacter sp.]